MASRRKSKETGDSDDDIWEYTSVKRVRTATSSIIAQQPSKAPGKKVVQKMNGKSKRLRQVKLREPITNSTSKSLHDHCQRKSRDDISEEKRKLQAERKDCTTISQNSSGSRSTARSALESHDTKSRQDPTQEKFTSQKNAQHEESCPSCQMPFSILTIESPRWHVTECMDLPLVATQECPLGVNCDSTIPSHFRKFRHTLLANSRAGVCAEQKAEDRVFNRKLDFDGACKGDENRLKSVERKLKNKTEEIPSALGSPSPLERNAKLTVDFVKERLFQTPEREAATKNSKMMQQSCLSQSVENPHELISGPESDQDIFADDEMETGSDLSSYSALCETVQQQTDEEAQGEGDEILQPCVDVCDSHGNLESKIRETCGPTDPKSGGVTCEKTRTLPDTSGDCNGDPASTIDLFEISDDDETLLAAVAEAEATEAEKSDLVQRTSSSTSPTKRRQTCANTKQSSVLDFFRPAWQKTKQLCLGSGAESAYSLVSSSSVTSSSDQKPTVRSNTTNPWALTTQRTSNAGLRSELKKGLGGSRWNQENRQCPFYKKIPGTSFTVDAFRYGSIPGCTAYFLSHFHADHYGGLSKKFKNPVYCSKATANLVKLKLRVEEKYIHSLPMCEPVVIDGVRVTLLEANHCPGSVLFLFQLPKGQNILHTGDFRASMEMENYPQLIGTKIHELYLDTTYCDPTYAFPPQKEVVKFAVNLVSDAVYLQPNLLVVTGSYTIGKEKIFMAIAEELNSKVCVTREKKAILDCLEDRTMANRLTLQKTQAKVHVLPMQWLNHVKLSEYLEDLKPRFDSVLAISPTGWTHSKTTALEKIRPRKSGNVTIYGLPYSEHSSFTELKRFVQITRPNKIIATVNNGNPASRRKMDTIFQSWLTEAEEGTPSKRARQSTLTSWFRSST